MKKFERVINAMGITFYKLEKIIPLKTAGITLLIGLLGLLIIVPMTTDTKIMDVLVIALFLPTAIVGMAYNASYIAAKMNQNGKEVFWIGLFLPVLMHFVVSVFYEDNSKELKT